MYRFHMRARTRKDAQGAGDLVRYLCREGEFAPKSSARDADVDYMTRQSLDTAEHDDLVGEPLVGNLPAWAEGNAGIYFAAASAHERVNGQYAIALQIALPRELSHAQHMRLTQDFLEATMPCNPYLVVKHEPVKDGQTQPHLHLLVGPRLEDGRARSPAQQFRRWNAAEPSAGGAQKDRFWNQRQAPHLLRLAFADLANYHLEQAGVSARIDPRSLRQQGIERDRISWHSEERPDEATRAKEQRTAVQAWEQRKVSKGLADIQGLPRKEMVRLVRGWTRDYARGQAIPLSSREGVRAYDARVQAHLREEAQALSAGIAHLTEHLAYVEREQRRRSLAQQVARLAQQLRDEDGIRRGRLRVHLEEERGMGW